MGNVEALEWSVEVHDEIQCGKVDSVAANKRADKTSFSCDMNDFVENLSECLILI